MDNQTTFAFPTPAEVTTTQIFASYQDEDEGTNWGSNKGYWVSASAKMPLDIPEAIAQIQKFKDRGWNTRIYTVTTTVKKITIEENITHEVI